MPTYRFPSDSEDDSSESPSLSQSTIHAGDHTSKLQTYYRTAKEQNKAANRDRDRKRATANRLKGKGKARRAGADEVNEDGVTSGEDLLVANDDSLDETTIDDTILLQMASSEMDGKPHCGDSSNHGDLTPPLPARPPKTNINYLPDHLFISVFSKAEQTRAVSQKGNTQFNGRIQREKRRRPGSTPKDLVIGSRVFKVLEDPCQPPSGAATVPSRRVKNFVDRTLGLKGKGSIRKGWQRKPAHLGVMEQSGPAAKFVRGSRN